MHLFSLKQFPFRSTLTLPTERDVRQSSPWRECPLLQEEDTVLWPGGRAGHRECSQTNTAMQRAIAKPARKCLHIHEMVQLGCS